MIEEKSNHRPPPGREAIEWVLADRRSEDPAPPKPHTGKNYNKILEAARNTLVELGYAKFSLREVESRAGVHLKSLQHYFKTKGDLVYHTLHHTLVEHYYESYIALFETMESSTYEEMLEATVRLLVSDGEDPQTSKLFFDLWALAARDEDARRAVEHFYSRYRHIIEWLIGMANPELGPSGSALRAAVVVAQIEGSMLFLSRALPEHAELAGLSDEVVRAMVKYALEPCDGKLVVEKLNESTGGIVARDNDLVGIA